MHELSENSPIYMAILPFIQDYKKKEESLTEEFSVKES